MTKFNATSSSILGLCFFVVLLALLSSSSTWTVDAFDIKSIAIAAPRIPGFTKHLPPRPAPEIEQVIPTTEALPEITTFEEATRIIDECALQETAAAQLYQAVRLVERNAYKYYPDMAAKEALWDRAQGCYKLVLSTGTAKTRSFHPPSYLFPFSFAMIQGEYFGNGFGLNQDMIWVSILQKHYYNMKLRQMVVTVKDIYMGGNKATKHVPDFVKKAINLGKTPEEFKEEAIRPPAFCIVAATEHALVARGNQSGGLAIWKRLDKDILPVAYKNIV